MRFHWPYELVLSGIIEFSVGVHSFRKHVYILGVYFMPSIALDARTQEYIRYTSF